MRFLAAAIFLLGAPSQQAVKLPVKLESKHFTLKTSATKERGQELLDYLERMHAALLEVLEPVNPEALAAKRVALVLYKDMAEFHATGGTPGIGAFTRGMTITGWDDGGLTLNSYAHELVHVFVALTSKNDLAYQDWFAEGFADVLGNSEIRDGKLHLAAKSGAIARMRLPIIQDALRSGKAVPLADFLTMSTERFMTTVPLTYAQGWSFCHFLMAGPAEEDRTRVLPEGRYRTNLMTYYKESRTAGIYHKKAWTLSFKGISVAALEKEWKEYVLGWTPERILGIRGVEREIENVGTGIAVDDLDPSGAGGQAGLRKGDVLVAIGGKRFSRGSALDELRIRIQDLTADKPAILSVRRDGKELSLEAVWRR